MSDQQIENYDHSAERGVLGSALTDPLRVVPMMIGEYALTQEVFHEPKNANVWQAIKTLHDTDARAGVDLLTVSDQLKQMQIYDDIGPGYLRDIVDSTPTSAHAQHYAGIILKKFMIRKGIEQCRTIEHELPRQADPETYLLKVPEKYIEIATRIMKEIDLQEIAGEIKEQYRKFYDNGDSLMWMDTGNRTLNEMLCGGLPPKYNLFAGRPSAGKTSFVDMLADYQAGIGNHVAYFTIDDDTEQKLTRMACRRAGVSLAKLNSKYARKNQRADFEDALEEVSRLPIHIDDRTFDIEQVASKARLWKAKYDIKLFCLDFIQNYEYHGTGKYLNDRERVTSCSRALFNLNKELRIPLAILSQFNREGASIDKPPTIQNIGDSGKIDQDMFTCIALSKNAEYHEANPDVNESITRAIRIEVLKHKFGKTGWKPWWFHGPYFYFEPAEHMWAQKSASYFEIERKEAGHDDPDE